MNERRILPLAKSPIKVYSNYAYLLSVLLLKDEAYNWLYSNFIQVKYISDRDENKRFVFNYSMGNLTKYFYNIPYLEVRSLDRKFMIKSIADLIEWLSKAIDMGYYVMIVVDNFYLPTKPEYMLAHNRHLLMLHGYDYKEKIFCSVGFDGKKYGESKIDFDDMLVAIKSCEGENDRIRDDACMLFRLQDEKKIQFLQKGFNYFSYEFDPLVVKRSLVEYLDSFASDNHFRSFYAIPQKYQYGIKYYEDLVQYLKKYVNSEYVGYIEEIAFQGMLEHKMLMVDRLRFMIEKGYIDENDDVVCAYERLALIAGKMRNLILKYNKTKNLKIIDGIIKDLEIMYEEEKNIVCEVINLL